MPICDRNRVTTYAIAFAILAGAVASEQARAQTPQDPGVTSPSPFSSLPASVPTSENTPGDIYVAYPVTINNGGGSTIYSIRISGTASSTMKFEAAYGSVTTFPFACSTTSLNPASTSISFTCIVDPLYSIPAGQSLTLPVAFKIPGTTTRTASDAMNFAFTALFREGLGSGSLESDGRLDGSSTTLVAADTTQSVAALLPPTGTTTIYTGKKGVPQGTSDRVATEVRAPGVGSYANGSITEAPLDFCPITNGNCKDLVTISIKNKDGATQTFPPSAPLVIILRRDALAFKGNINNLGVYYEADPGESTAYNGFIPPCANGSDPLMGLPRCVFERKVIRKSDPEYQADPSSLGDAQITIWATENGKIYW